MPASAAVLMLPAAQSTTHGLLKHCSYQLYLSPNQRVACCCLCVLRVVCCPRADGTVRAQLHRSNIPEANTAAAAAAAKQPSSPQCAKQSVGWQGEVFRGLGSPVLQAGMRTSLVTAMGLQLPLQLPAARYVASPPICMPDGVPWAIDGCMAGVERCGYFLWVEQVCRHAVWIRGLWMLPFAEGRGLHAL